MDRQMVFGLMPYSSNSSGESWEWGWVDCEVLYICYIGKQGEEFQIVHKPPVFLLATLNPVSYTHLDVYKRQEGADLWFSLRRF